MRFHEVRRRIAAPAPEVWVAGLSAGPASTSEEAR